MNIALVLALSVTVGPQAAPVPPPAPVAGVDARWAPWLGCWRPEHPASGDTRVCLVPGTAGAVRRLTIDADEILAEESIFADAAPHAVEDRDCRGSERAQWLADRRLVRIADLTCGKDAPRTVSGVSFVVRGPVPVWVEAQGVDSGGIRNVRVQRFRRDSNQQLPEALGVASPVTRSPAPEIEGDAPWSIDAVIEASRVLPPEVVEAALSEVNTPFPLSAKALMRMDKAGVSESVIDLMVALSNPKRFTVRRADGTMPGGLDEAGPWPGFEESLFEAMTYAGFMYPGFYYHPLFDSWGDGFWGSCVGFWSCSDFPGYPSPYYADYSYYPGDWVPVSPVPPGGGGGGGETRPHGRVVNGQGYTQVSVRSEAVPRSGGSGGSSSGDSGSSGTSSGSSASPQGYSSGSSGGGERTAQPRGPGGS
jgi:hypothetical protein